MTSNAGAQMIMEPKHLGFMSGDTEKRDYERMKSGVMEEVRRMFNRELHTAMDENDMNGHLIKNLDVVHHFM